MTVVSLIFQVVEAVVNKECEDGEEVLTAEMAKLKVEFIFFEEFSASWQGNRKESGQHWTTNDNKLY